MGKEEAVMETEGVVKDSEEDSSELVAEEVVAMGGCRTISVWIEEVCLRYMPHQSISVMWIKEVSLGNMHR
jgi:hypothetical protein